MQLLILKKIFNTNPFNIKFTLEKEVDGTINFLDVSIMRKQNRKLSFNWYRKPTWSDRYLNFNSHHPLRNKKSVINNLVDRAVLVSDIEFQTSYLKLITDILEENDYPIFFIQEIINQRLLTLKQKTRLGNNHIDINTESKPCFSIPYIEGLSEKISGILHSYNLNNAYKNKKILK